MKRMFYLSGTLIVLSTAITAVSPAHACNGDCDDMARLYTGAAALGTTIAIPLIGLGIDKVTGGENSPYWPAVGFTALTSSAGAWIAYQRYVGDLSTNELGLIGFPLVFGSVTTVLVYTLWPRPSNNTASREFKHNAPQIEFTSTRDGSFIGFSWQF